MWWNPPVLDQNRLSGGRGAVVVAAMAIGLLVSMPASASAWTGIINSDTPDQTSTTTVDKR